MNRFSIHIRYMVLLFMTMGTFLCFAAELIDIGGKTARLGFRVAEFSPAIPKLISNIGDGKILIDQTSTVLISQVERLINAFSPGSSDGLPELFEQTMSAYVHKKYDTLGFSKIGAALEVTVPQLMSIILQTYPFIYFFIERICKPVLPLTMDIGTILENSFIANFSRDTLTIIDSGAIQEVYTIMNELDTLLSYDLLPRMTDLFAEIDRVLPQMAKLGFLK